MDLPPNEPLKDPAQPDLSATQPPMPKDTDNEEENDHDATLLQAEDSDEVAVKATPKPVFTTEAAEAKAEVKKTVDVPQPAASTAANPHQRLSEELLALFDSKMDPGELKAAAAAIIKTILDNPPGSRPPENKDLHASTRVENRSRFIPVLPKIDTTVAAGPVSSYDALKRPTS